VLKNCGLSFFELLAGLTIISILFFLCLPLGFSIVQNNRLEVIKDEITAAVHYARNRAVLQELPLILTPLPDATDWSAGMLLFVDNKKHQYSPKATLIHQWQWKHRGIQVSWRGLHSDHYLLFPANLKHAAVDGHFIIQSNEGKILKLTINRLGRVRS
jgi:Tfp pilus assembly protein FimT